MNEYKYLLSNSGIFHHLEVAKVLYENKKLSKLVCGYPWFKLKNKNVPKDLIDRNFFINVLKNYLPNSSKLKFVRDYLNMKIAKKIDFRAGKFINDADVFLSLSTTGLETGKLMKKKNKLYICERSSTHIIFQNDILKEEYKNLDLKYSPINSWNIDRELEEYENSDFILVPSKFVEGTFKKKNIYKSKVINFGSYEGGFYPLKDLRRKDNEFNILFVGQLSVRKGLHYLIEAFSKFNHPNKKLHIVGSETNDKFFFRDLIKKNNDGNNIYVHGTINHKHLNKFFNTSHVFVLTSLEEGLATVTLQASSAGCPLIVTENTGAAEFVNDNNCGYVVPIRNSKIITEKLTLLADDKNLLNKFSINALKFSKNHTWHEYVSKLDSLVEKFIKKI